MLHTNGVAATCYRVLCTRLWKAKNTRNGRTLISVLFLYTALSWNAPKVRLFKYFRDLELDNRPMVVAVGAMAKGKDTFADSYVDTKIGK